MKQMDNQNLVNYIENRKSEIQSLIALDKEIKADPYTNVALYIEIQKIEKIMKKGGE